MAFTKEQHDTLVAWIRDNIIPRDTINHDYDTCHIRAAYIRVQQEKGDTYFYIDNDSINDVMLELGYRAEHYREAPYLHFNMSSQSPVLQTLRNKIWGSQ